MKLSILIFLFVAIFVSCTKNEISITRPSSEVMPVVKVVNGVLRIQSRTDFEQITNQSTSERQSLLVRVKNEGFVQMSDKNNVTSANRMVGNCNFPDEVAIENKTFLDLLNTNGVISIGNDTYRLDWCNDKLFVISNNDASDQSKYNAFLSANQSNTYIGAFPLQIDVLDAINLGHRTMPSIPNTNDEDGLFAQRITIGQSYHEKMYWNDTRVGEETEWRDDKRMDGVIRYDAFGIFFHLYAKEKYLKKNALSMWVATIDGTRDWIVTYDLYCKPRKRDVIVENRIILNPGYGTNSNENKLDKTFYQGNRRVDDALIRWDVTMPVAREVEVYRGQVQSNQQFIFFNSQPQLGIMSNFIGSYIPNLVPASNHPSKPYLFKW